MPSPEGAQTKLLEDPTTSGLPERERITLSTRFVEDEFFRTRIRFRRWSELTGQSAQFDDGYLSQHAVSLITGQEGSDSHGKGKDLASGDEIKSGRRIDQKGSKEDSHILFTFGNKEELERFLRCENCFIAFFDRDQLGRPRFEIWQIKPSSEAVRRVFKSYWAEQLNGSGSKWRSRQLNLRIYPDRSRERFHPVFLSLEPRLVYLARDLNGDGTATPEVFKVTIPDPPDISVIAGHAGNRILGEKEKEIPLPTDLRERLMLAAGIFSELGVERLRRLTQWRKLTQQPINTGFDILAQHMVSLVTGIRGTGSNARGLDLEDGSEIKSVAHMGGQDRPRWDCGRDWKRILGWKDLYLVQWDRNRREMLRVRVSKPQMDEFRTLVSAYREKYPGSDNFQLHPIYGRSGMDRDRNVAKNSCGNLDLELLAMLEEEDSGSVHVVGGDLDESVEPEVPG